MDRYGWTILIGVLIGVLTRLIMLRSDYRQYPGYPHGFVTHISLGFIAAGLGAVAVPALFSKEWTAITFLALAAQQFREIRSMERDSLAAMEEAALVSRGVDYIEGIARVFEARNYLVMAVAFLSALAFELWGALAALVVAILFTLIAQKLMKGQVLGDIALVRPGLLHFDGTRLLADEIDFMTVGLPKMREIILRDGLGVIISPRDHNAKSTLHQMGQRQAIAHVAASILGVKIDVDYPELMPLVRKNIDTGEIALYIVPVVKDMNSLIEAVKRVPLLESSQRRPMQTRVGGLINGRVKK